MSESRAAASNRGTGVIPRISAMRIATGAISTIMVTLGSTVESKVVIVPNITTNSQGSPCDSFPATMATYSKKPVRCNSMAMIIIPRSKPRVLKSMAYKASS